MYLRYTISFFFLVFLLFFLVALLFPPSFLLLLHLPLLLFRLLFLLILLLLLILILLLLPLLQLSLIRRDKFWSVNKSVLEEISPRYMGVSTVDTVVFTVTNLPSSNSVDPNSGISCVSVQVHPQKPGKKSINYGYQSLL